MSSSPRIGAVCALLLFLMAGPAQAQGGKGIAMTGGAGIGWARPACEYCRRQLSAGPAAYLQMTTPVNPRLSLGVEANFWARDDEVFELMGSLGAVAVLFTNPGGPFHLKAGIAYLSYRAYDDDGDLVSNAPAMQLGAGYRFRISDELALTNFVNVITSRFGTLRSDDAVVVENMGITAFQLGVAITRF